MSNSELIVIADLGTGNLRSVSKAVCHVSPQSQVVVSSQPEVIVSAGHLILPGQGAVGTWFDQLNSNSALRDAVMYRLQHGPVLGICLGLQALYSFSSENGGVPGLGILSGKVRHFSENCEDREMKFVGKIPHMGWNRVSHKKAHPLWRDIDDGERFYFVHSYYVHSDEPGQVMGQCDYGFTFTAAAAKSNIFAVQFHPEKSQHAGLILLRNFINWNGVH